MAHGMGDYYKILGLTAKATPSEVRQAYRTLALRWHPDKNPANHVEAKQKFQEVSAAYEVLSDSQKRSAFDRSRQIATTSSSRPFGSSFSRSRNRTAARAPAPNSNTFTFRRPEDVFQEFFGPGTSVIWDEFPNMPGTRLMSFNNGGFQAFGNTGNFSSSTVVETNVNGVHQVTTTTQVNGVETVTVVRNGQLVSSTERYL